MTEQQGSARPAPGAGVTAPNLVRVLRDERDRIVATFVAEVVRKDLAPDATPRSSLVDHIPRFLDEIIAELAGGREVRNSQDADDTSATARRHGEQRWQLGYDIEAVVREYGVLRHVILRAAKDVGATVSIDEFDALAKCLNVGVAEATTEYIRFRDSEVRTQKANLQFLSEASELLSSSLDYRWTLRRLTGLQVPRLADWCAVHFDDGDPGEPPVAHVDPAKIPLLSDLYRRYPPPSEPHTDAPGLSPGVGPRMVEHVDRDLIERATRNSEHRDLVVAVGVTSFLVVPLQVQGATLGSMTLAYGDSGRRYTEDDLVLAKELARRAAMAIGNAKLYELSQNERSRVEAATRAKDEFVAMVSHELRTPLNAILGWLHLMRGGTLTSERREHALDVIERNAQAQSQLVADLLDISRVITGKIRINPAQVDLANVVEMAIEGVRPAADAKRIRLELDIGRDGTVMRGDGDRLQQVFWNLLANAVKFTPKGGAIRVALRRVDSDLEVTVEDNGRGISPEFLPHVFEAFRQADAGSTRSHGGLGIGLSIVKHLVELHGGAIEARSAGVGLGAAFVVRLPVSPLVSTTLGIGRLPVTPDAGLADLPAGLQGIQALVVEDDPDARELVGYLLTACGVEVRLAASAAEALTELERYTPDILISDIGLPEEDGYALIRRVRTMAAADKRSIPAIALTAFAGISDRSRALVDGFNLHLVKPVEPTALVKAIAELAHRSAR